MKNRFRLIVLIGIVFLFSACTVPGGAGGENKKADGAENGGGAPDKVTATVSDSMTAAVDGTQYSFELDSATVNHGKIEVSYSAYNPRGERMYNVKLYFDKDIAPGSYSSQNSDTEFRIHCGLLSVSSGSAFTEAVGSYELELTSRDSDWLTYQGIFSAELGRSSLSGTYGAQSMSITDASFCFTIT